MKRVGLVLLIIVIAGFVAFWYITRQQTVVSPLGKKLDAVLRPLDQYSFPNLHKTKFSPSSITLGKVLHTDPSYISQLFYYRVPISLTDQTKTKRVSGVINIPTKPGIYPIIVMFRGFVPDNAYQSGVGTQPSAAVFAANGFITLAPDFLDFGESDKGAIDPFENRFQTYTTALDLLASVKNLNQGLAASYSGSIQADPTKVGIWGHSNGGHIALSVLEITSGKYPTVLWAPVSQMFPYSILYYINESDDHGKGLIKLVANFEDIYDAEQYSLINYFDWIQASIQVHQGTADDEVPQKWSDDLVATLQKKNKDVTYFTYPGENHNFLNGSFPVAVQRSIAFYQSKL